jgi:hypothetical protein
VWWGLGPKVVNWLYVTIVRPTISFASLVMCHGCQMANTMNNLSKLQRLACLGITEALHTTPTGATESLVGLPPLDLLIQGEARAAAHRLWSWGAVLIFTPKEDSVAY